MKASRFALKTSSLKVSMEIHWTSCRPGMTMVPLSTITLRPPTPVRMKAIRTGAFTYQAQERAVQTAARMTSARIAYPTMVLSSGVRLLFHRHHGPFQAVEVEQALDLMLERIGVALLEGEGVVAEGLDESVDLVEVGRRLVRVLVAEVLPDVPDLPPVHVLHHDAEPPVLDDGGGGPLSRPG